MAVGESRTELLSWLNSTLQLDYPKVEHCGTGAAYCQIMDLIYGLVPMSKVKFGYPLSDYDSRSNMKILQAAFNKHKITKLVEVERLIKCRLQDNLELLQWFKRHWLEHCDVGVVYDAAGRRNAKAGTESTSRPTSRRLTMAETPRAVTPTTKKQYTGLPASAKPGPGSATSTSRVANRRVVSTGTVAHVGNNQVLEEKNDEINNLKEELKEMRILTESLETERNFYYNKLREIEILTENIQTLWETEGENRKTGVLELVRQIQSILYQTEKGFDGGDAMDAESF